MDKSGFLIVGSLVFLGCIVIMPDEMLMVADALYSIPPTPAWTTIEINNNAVLTNNSEINITASNSNDKFYLVSDGSILINITEFDP